MPLGLSGAKGTLFVIGGGSRPLSLMDGVVRRMSSKQDLVIVLPMASSEPDTSAFYGERPFLALGCTDVHTLHLQKPGWGEAQLDSIRNAGALYLCGGDQARFMKVASGAIAAAIRDAYLRGCIVSGSSAGAAMMSSVMITGDQNFEPEYERTYARIEAGNGIYERGLGLIPHAIIDQHFVERSRYNRAFSALHDHPGMPVYGIGESTALVVEPEGISVEGEGQVVVFRANPGRSDSLGRIGFSNVELDILLPGERCPV